MKKLDKEDIISLDFEEFTSDGLFIKWINKEKNEFFLLLFGNLSNPIITMSGISKSEDYISISRSIGENNTNLFTGYIVTKSELKIVLKQIRVN